MHDPKNPRVHAEILPALAGVPDPLSRPDRPAPRASDRSRRVIRRPPFPIEPREQRMHDPKNPRVHAEILPALAAVIGSTTKILAIGSITAKGTPEAMASV